MSNPELERGSVVLPTVHEMGGTGGKGTGTANCRKKIDLPNMFPNFLMNEWEASNEADLRNIFWCG